MDAGNQEPGKWSGEALVIHLLSRRTGMSTGVLVS